jgi:hypothetical protein
VISFQVRGWYGSFLSFHRWDHEAPAAPFKMRQKKRGLQFQKSGVMIKENNRNLQRKKERTKPGRFVQERNQTGGGVVLKMTTDCAVCVKTKGSKAS